MKKIFVLLLMATACFPVFASASGIIVSCQGDASASHKDRVSEEETLNRYGQPFRTSLVEGKSLFIGAFYGGCGHCGLSGIFEASIELRNQSNKVLFWNKALGVQLTLPFGPQKFQIERYGKPLELQCVLEQDPNLFISETAPDCCYEGTCRFNCS